MKNEQTSKRVGSIAGKIYNRLLNFKPVKPVQAASKYLYGWNGFSYETVCTIADLKSVVGSVETQRPDKVKK